MDDSGDTQRGRFIEAACQVGADEDEATFKAKHKPKGEVPEPREANDAT